MSLHIADRKPGELKEVENLVGRALNVLDESLEDDYLDSGTVKKFKVAGQLFFIQTSIQKKTGAFPEDRFKRACQAARSEGVPVLGVAPVDRIPQKEDHFHTGKQLSNPGGGSGGRQVNRGVPHNLTWPCAREESAIPFEAGFLSVIVTGHPRAGGTHGEMRVLEQIVPGEEVNLLGSNEDSFMPGKDVMKCRRSGLHGAADDEVGEPPHIASLTPVAAGSEMMMRGSRIRSLERVFCSRLRWSVRGAGNGYARWSEA